MFRLNEYMALTFERRRSAPLSSEALYLYTYADGKKQVLGADTETYGRRHSASPGLFWLSPDPTPYYAGHDAASIKFLLGYDVAVDYIVARIWFVAGYSHAAGGAVGQLLQISYLDTLLGSVADFAGGSVVSPADRELFVDGAHYPQCIEFSFLDVGAVRDAGLRALLGFPEYGEAVDIKYAKIDGVGIEGGFTRFAAYNADSVYAKLADSDASLYCSLRLSDGALWAGLKHRRFDAEAYLEKHKASLLDTWAVRHRLSVYWYDGEDAGIGGESVEIRNAAADFSESYWRPLPPPAAEYGQVACITHAQLDSGLSIERTEIIVCDASFFSHPPINISVENIMAEIKEYPQQVVVSAVAPAPKLLLIPQPLYVMVSASELALPVSGGRIAVAMPYPQTDAVYFIAGGLNIKSEAFDSGQAVFYAPASTGIETYRVADAPGNTLAWGNIKYIQ